jgi:hypothetical protein
MGATTSSENPFCTALLSRDGISTIGRCVRGTFLFDAVAPDLPTDLPRGQVIVRGVALFDGNFGPLMPLTFAIVGGTGPTRG